MFSEELKTIRRLGWRYAFLQVLNFASVIASGLMIWKGLGLICNTESPIVVVLSGSMEPAFYRGDLLFLTNPSGQRYKTGDITVYRIPNGDIPIVHRVIETRDVVSDERASLAHSTPKLAHRIDAIYVAAAPLAQKQLLLTKGDNNAQDDIGLYQGLQWLEKRHIIGKVGGFLPHIGYVTIVMNDYPQLKYALLGGLGLLALVQRE
ncbi:uncharacterized protein FOMMEDRAFT_168400 [Fomitiporia mediterranea MF3/22]|uniref:uncharacterized protein n=1 Tax=Fomitiporia mediterranea (strain MF3/22) TaxID=694068 RepID=UPI00044097B6|nr:uncharacterized protein FOMMEDRAFT_168400 [Fomitiporia mediterranea MF3/22]EJD01773.1 hypothetical protein FOMMEDRAFT_168400 [Fomitiporia mediterranea MF3/22]